MPKEATELLTAVLQVLQFELFTVGAAPITLLSILTALVIVLLATRLSRLIQRGIVRTLRARKLEDAGTEALLTRLTHYLVMSGGVAIALQALGFDLGSLFAAGAIFAVGIGFAMQNIAQNFVSGLILLVERSIRPGDVLRIDERMVKVTQMGIRSTVVRTLDDAQLIVPNATLVQNTVSNLTYEDREIRVRADVGVDYDSDMHQVKAVLERVGHSFQLRVLTREPVVQLRGFGSSSVDWQLSVWTDDPWALDRVASTLRQAVWDAFQAEGIVIAFPQVDLHLDSEVVQRLGQAG